MLPFDRDQFFDVFASYNSALWPASIVAYAAAAIVIFLLLVKQKSASHWLSLLLAIMWGWTGAFYHALYFAAINFAAYVFALLFLAQAFLLPWYGIVSKRLRFTIWPGSRAVVGWLFIAYSTIAYPMIGPLAGHSYSSMPQFGVTPCPVTLFTFGALLLAERPVPWPVFVIPVIWSLIGGSAAILLSVPQDWLLLAGGAITLLAYGLLRHSEEKASSG